MDRELERYHKNNALLELNIQDNELKKKSVQSTMKAGQDDAARARLTIRRFPALPHPASSPPPFTFCPLAMRQW